MVERRKSRTVTVGSVPIGGTAPIAIQSMAKAAPDDVAALSAQVQAAADGGCHIMRLAVPNRAALAPFAAVCAQSPLPLVADIHFNAALALGALDAGAAKIRINPGNMSDWGAIAEVVAAAREKGAAIRIGVNSGSVRHKDADPAARSIGDALTAEVLDYAERIQAMGFRDLVLSLKANDAATTIAANLAVAARTDCPLHLGVTAAGPEEEATLKSAVGIGGLLAQGIGDTIRLSFTGPPAREVAAARDLLRAVGHLRDRVAVISCPTCGRCRVDLQKLVAAVKERLSHIDTYLQVAVMGCEVNGPGEAQAADIGIAAGKGKFALFQGGRRCGTVPEAEALEVLCTEVEALAAARRGGAARDGGP